MEAWRWRAGVSVGMGGGTRAAAGVACRSFTLSATQSRRGWMHPSSHTTAWQAVAASPSGLAMMSVATDDVELSLNTSLSCRTSRGLSGNSRAVRELREVFSNVSTSSAPTDSLPRLAMRCRGRTDASTRDGSGSLTVWSCAAVRRSAGTFTPPVVRSSPLPFPVLARCGNSLQQYGMYAPECPRHEHRRCAALAAGVAHAHHAPLRPFITQPMQHRARSPPSAYKQSCLCSAQDLPFPPHSLRPSAPPRPLP